MDQTATFKRSLGAIAWGTLLIWWGIVIAIDPLTIAIGAIGSGVILVGVNAILAFKGIPGKAGNIELGLISIAWGALDQVRHMLGLPVALSFALLLFVLGVDLILTPLFRRAGLQDV
jgi:hypothetical protein